MSDAMKCAILHTDEKMGTWPADVKGGPRAEVGGQTELGERGSGQEVVH